MNNIIDFSLIIPTLNESKNIKLLLDQVTAILRDYSYEIIVADDNSPDGTADIVDGLTKTNPRLKLLRRHGKKGLSAAVVDGFKVSSGKVLAVMDADLSHDPKLLPEFLKGINEGFEMVVGSRYITGGGADHWPWHRRIYSYFGTMLAIKLFHLPIKDPMSGYFACRRDIFEKAESTLNPLGYKILLELLLRGQVNSIKEIPFIFIDRKQGHSKMSGKVVSQYLLMLIQLRPYIRAFHWLRKIYHEGRYKKVVAMIGNGRLLDIGCGQPCETLPDQAFLRFLNRPGSVGLDIKPIKGPFEFHQGSIDKLPFPDQSFENVVAMEVLEHVADWETSIKEIKRVLQVGGAFVMSTPACNPVVDFLWDLWTKSIGQMWHEAHVVNLQVKDWVRILEHEFTLVKISRHWGIDVLYSCIRK